MEYNLLVLDNDCLSYVLEKLGPSGRFMFYLVCWRTIGLKNEFKKLFQLTRTMIISNGLWNAFIPVLNFLKMIGMIRPMTCQDCFHVPYLSGISNGVRKNFQVLMWYMDEILLPGEKEKALP